MIIFKQGAIVLVPFPFSDLTKSKVRPVLVLSSNEYNKTHLDCIVCGITTNLTLDDYSIIINTKDVIYKRLKHESRIKIDCLTFLDKRIFLKEIDLLKDEIFARVLDKLVSIF